MLYVEYAQNTVEPLRVEITSRTRTGVQLTYLGVELAVTVAGVEPASGDWNIATWEQTPGPRFAIARVLYTFGTRGRFQVHSRLSEAPQSIIKHAGLIQVT